MQCAPQNKELRRSGHMRQKVGVVADDVTGANDIGIMFSKGGYRSAVFPLELIGRCDLKKEAEGLDVIIIDTDSRFDTPETAKRKVRRATELLASLPCDMYHNKTCSVFRGNIGAEFDEMQDVLGISCSMVILGFPANGRTTKDGIHYVYGEKLENSQFRHDPIHPMTTSSLEEIIHKQSKRKVGHITWKDLDQGLSHVKERKEELKKQCAYVIFDIRSQEDLKLAARAVADEVNICGSSAVGEELPRAYQEMDSPVLAVCGSLTEQSRSQVDYLRKKEYPVFEFHTDLIFTEEKREAAVEELSGQLQKAMTQAGCCLLHTSNSKEAVERTKRQGQELGLTDEEVGKRISHVMCRITANVLQKSGCRRLVVAGGDTSAAVTEQLQIFRMDIGEEIEAGVPVMKGKTILGELELVLKSGSFGSEAFLEKAIEAVRQQKEA